MKSILISTICMFLLNFTVAFALPVEARINSQPSVPIKIQPAIDYFSKILHRQNIADLPVVNSSLYRNDEVLSVRQLLGQRSGIVGEQYRWPGQINVQISTVFSNDQYNIIYAALAELAGTMTNCRGFVVWPQNANPIGDYIYITNTGPGCWSYVGRQGGRQILNLETPWCVDKVLVIHVIGFHHEQIRPDRDSYVAIFWENIERGREHNFEESNLFSLTFSVPYDYYSIMHYDERGFSWNGGKTIQAKQSGIVVGSRGVVTPSDRQKRRSMCSA